VRWTDYPIHFIDFEGSVSSGVLEFGVVTLRGGQIAETRTRFCRPRGPIKPEDEAVHGLRADQLASYAPFMDEFDYFATLRETGPLAAHYATAENTLLKSIWPYVRKVPDFAKPGQTLMEWGPWIDTGRLYLDNFRGASAGKLEQLVQVFQLQGELAALAGSHCPPDRRHYHAALYDALAGALLLRTLEGRLQRGPLTLLWLLHASTANPQKRAGLTQGDLF
jgi:DNA polymerase III epsilon subunit-like protein